MTKRRSVRRNSTMWRKEHSVVLAGLAVAALIPVAYVSLPDIFATTYKVPADTSTVAVPNTDTSNHNQDPAPVIRRVAEHLPTPEPVKAIYMTACVAGTPSFREDLVSIIETTEINSLVIDIKDYSGGISFDAKDSRFDSAEGVNCFASDMEAFIERLHDRGIYVIGRITVFQDPHYSTLYPELAVKRESDGAVWKDYKGLSFIDVSATEYWDYIVALSKESYAIGFDELNFDYVRFPSDGNMKDIHFEKTGGKNKAEALERFFAYLHKELRDLGPSSASGQGPVLSVDIFGMTTTNTDDLNIGQVLERTLPYFDYVAPMVYPSHYPKGFNGWGNPNHYPYEVIKYSMDSAVRRTVSSTSPVETLLSEPLFREEKRFDPVQNATTTEKVFTGLYTKESYSPLKLRTWIQDFDYGGTYDIPEVQAQIKATYDAGLTSWMIWAPSNRYTVGALERE